MKFKKELEQLINKHSIENGSDTPDFIIAEFTSTCLEAFNVATKKRDQWYNDKTLTINQSIIILEQVLNEYTKFDSEELKNEYLLDIVNGFKKKLNV